MARSVLPPIPADNLGYLQRFGGYPPVSFRLDLEDLVIAWRTALLVAVATAAVGGCSNAGAAGGAPTLRAGSPSTSATSAAPTPTSLPPLVVLPESMLSVIPGISYRAGPGTDAERITAFRTYSTHPEFFVGGLVRDIYFQGHKVGGIEVVRFTSAASEAGVSAQSAIRDFAQVEPGASTLVGHTVWQVDHPRGTKVGAVAWMTGADMVLIWSDTLADARKIADAYLKAA